MFDDKLKIAITYATEAGTHEVEGSDIEELRLELRPWGFSGRVRFQVQILEPGMTAGIHPKRGIPQDKDRRKYFFLT